MINIKNENILKGNLDKCQQGTKKQYSLCCYILSLFCKSDPEFEYSVETDGKIKSLFNKAIQIDNLFEIILNLMNIDEEKYYTKGSISL